MTRQQPPRRSAWVGNGDIRFVGNGEDVFVLPASFAQERLWLLDQLGAGAAYNIFRGVRLKGPLKLHALRGSLSAVVGRHESLRTSFGAVDGVPVQRIRPEVALECPLVDLSDGPDGFDREAELRRLAVEEAERPFDLGRSPLLRAVVVRLADQDHVLLLTIHHSVSDGWSMGLLTRELSALYGAFCAGRASPLAELRIQYADFAQWQREWLQGRVLEEQLSYWRKQLSGVSVLQLSTDHPRPAVQTYAGRLEPLELGEELARGLTELSRREGVTLFMTLLAGFCALLARYAGQTDIVVGSPIANRVRREIEDVIGFFVNTLTLRIDLSGNPSFRALLGRVREVALGAYAHQDVPFEKLVEELQPKRDLSQTPLFQVLFALQNGPAEELELPGLEVQELERDRVTARFDLELHLWAVDQTIRGFFVYNTDLYDAETVRQMLRHFEGLLEEAVAEAERPVFRIPLLRGPERRRVLAEWNDTAADYGKTRCVHELFEEQVVRTPDALAVVCEGRELSYAQLNAQANRRANYLRKLGVGPEVCVAICMERSIEMLLGVLAILKAGGAYVPLDPGYPEERLNFMLEDARVAVLLTERRFERRLGSGQLKAVCLDADSDGLVDCSEQNPGSGALAENLAYVIYTSGSTGQPKGVAMHHGPLYNLVSWQKERSGDCAGSRTLQFASLSFDVSFQEIFSTWLGGGTLTLIGESERRDPATLLSFLRSQSVERMFLPFVALQQVADAAARRRLDGIKLRQIVTAGEQLQITRSIAALFRRLPGCVLENQYGPSETHVVTAHALVDSPDVWPQLPPIGRPVANSQIYILDADLEPSPVGVAGEIYIGGQSLARGYLYRPGLSAERFVPDPFSTVPGRRLYRTGDVGVYLPDGTTEFLGRKDQQVKIRGYRVELGEVEVALAGCEGVREAVVVAHDEIPGDRRLVAYVVWDEQGISSTDRLRQLLDERLPDYMVPFAVVVLNSLPLTPSGKVDRKALPAWRGLRPELVVDYLMPRTRLEAEIARVWREALRLERVGAQDNFFELGGHSLLMARVQARLGEVLDRDISMIELFQYPTVRSLAEHLEGEDTEQGSEEESEARAEKLSDGRSRLMELSERRRGRSRP